MAHSYGKNSVLPCFQLEKRHLSELDTIRYQIYCQQTLLRMMYYEAAMKYSVMDKKTLFVETIINDQKHFKGNNSVLMPLACVFLLVLCCLNVGLGDFCYFIRRYAIA